MRIVLLNQYYRPSEAPTAVLGADLAQALAARGHEVHAIASSRAYEDPRRTYRRRERIDGVAVRRSWSSGFGRAGKLGRVLDYVTFLVGAAWALMRVPRPDLVIAMTTPPMLVCLAVPICRWRGARLLYWVMDLYPDLAFELGVLRSDGWIAGLLRRAARRSIIKADRIVALGSVMAERLAAQGARRVDIVDNWCDGELIRPRSRDAHPTRRVRGWDGKFVVLYSGNMGLAHEFSTVLDAAVRLADRSEIVFAFVGGGAREQEVRCGARARGLEQIQFHPRVETSEISAGLTAGDLHLVTLRDGLQGLLVPSKIYGILAAGRPAVHVGPAHSEVATILSDADSGATVAPGDVDGLVRVIKSYADDPQRWSEHGVNARRAFEEKYDRRHALKKLSELIESLEAPSEKTR